MGGWLPASVSSPRLQCWPDLFCSLRPALHCRACSRPSLFSTTHTSRRTSLQPSFPRTYYCRAARSLTPLSKHPRLLLTSSASNSRPRREQPRFCLNWVHLSVPTIPVPIQTFSSAWSHKYALIFHLLQCLSDLHHHDVLPCVPLSTPSHARSAWLDWAPAACQLSVSLTFCTRTPVAAT